ncbi:MULTISPECIES: hypothetical protein [Streptomyces]|uniref:hypothetical protein n=1 Tax=Streptomyces TaxID=1883 RepID=UPI0029B08E83|nr:hypothetical protein [Streptomyces stelliscabiei]MDX2514587.1 hypothetical protein [Streptomyces stelliscabiei]MDX2661149.1 hypothetical protein [Streptomyces stelliscabiei]MDX2790126.1 hypothetical protein [Streptomyces stelliscabiei]
MVFPDPQHDARERIARTARTVQHTRTAHMAIRLLLTRGIHPQVTRCRPTESPWLDVTFTHAATSVRWSNTYYRNGHNLRFTLLPLSMVPIVLAAVSSARDSELAAFHDPSDFKGDAAQWLDAQTAGLLGVADSRPMPGYDEEASDTPVYSSELSGRWQVEGIALVELSGPDMTAVCNLEILRLSEAAAHAVITAYAGQIPPR